VALIFIMCLSRPARRELTANQPEVDDADQELESGPATVCDPLRRSFTVRSARRHRSLIVMNPVCTKILTRSSFYFGRNLFSERWPEIFNVVVKLFEVISNKGVYGGTKQ